MTKRELQKLLGSAERPKADPKLCAEHQALALRTVTQLEQLQDLQEQALRTLGACFEDFTLPKALIGAIGISATEIRSQLPALRESVKEAGK